ncbi:hypothetical protein [Blautia luti]|uniref:hypothetical protein n=1 Tax=Blautia luti TaxID=89014 RepID=UPI00156FF861|nr:hypothetical protein [Blautia luti]NSK85843.1 hypothetical protein [Blautia luti]
MDKDLMEELGLMATDSQLDYIDTLLDQAGGVLEDYTDTPLEEANAGNYDSKETFVEALAWQLLYFLQDNDLSILKPEGE